MDHNSEDTQNNSNNGNDGFVWSQRLTVVTGMVIALVVAAAHFAPALAAPLEWLPH
jgi:hypothetical protein